MKLKSFATVTHQGPYLQVNEDGYDFDLNDNLFMLFDGFGGSGIGDLCVNDLKVNIKKFYKNIAEDKNATLPFFFSPRYLIEGNALINAMLFCNKDLYEKNLEKEMSKRAGASSILGVVSESVMTLVSVGNCVCYLVRNGKLSQVFVPDDYRYISGDHYSQEFKTMPMGAFGLFSDLHYQVKELRIQEDDKILIMTDGAYARVSEEEVLYSIIKEGESLESKLNTIFNLSNKHGNLDNQSAILLEF
jgi:serine/threonine protein phosphatase PrpC